MLAFFYVIFGIAIVLFELLRKKKYWLNYLTIFNIYFVAYYIFPAIMINGKFGGYSSRMSRLYLNANIEGTAIAAIVMLFSYWLIVFGYTFEKNIKFKKRDNQQKYIPNEDRFIKGAIVIFLSIGLISLIVYGSLFGGLRQLLYYTNQIRNSAIASENSSIEFVRRFIPALMYSSYFIYARYLTNKSVKYIVLALIVASPWFIVNGGRGAILTYLLILFFSYILQSRKKIPVIKGLIISVVIIIGINYLRPIFMSFEQLQYGLSSFNEAFINYSSSGKYNMNSILDYIYMLSDSFSSKYISLEVAIDSVNSGQHQMNFFYEFIIALFSVVPSSFLPFDKSASIVSYNTQYITGVFRSQIPPGGVAFSYYTMSLPGVIIISLLFGLLGRKLELFFTKLKSKYANILYVIYMYLWIFTFLNGELRHTIQRDFLLVIFLIVLILKTKFLYTNKKNELGRCDNG